MLSTGQLDVNKAGFGLVSVADIVATHQQQNCGQSEHRKAYNAKIKEMTGGLEKISEIEFVESQAQNKQGH